MQVTAESRSAVCDLGVVVACVAGTHTPGAVCARGFRAGLLGTIPEGWRRERESESGTAAQLLCGLSTSTGTVE